MWPFYILWYHPRGSFPTTRIYIFARFFSLDINAVLKFTASDVLVKLKLLQLNLLNHPEDIKCQPLCEPYKKRARFYLLSNLFHNG